MGIGRGSRVELAHTEDAELVKEEFRLDELVEECIGRARSRFPELRFETDLEAVSIAGVRDRLERAIWNLLKNTGKWSRPDGTVEISLRGGELRVRDHGPGISDEDKPHVFERFYRAISARSTPGSGLGLAIVSDVVETHAGSVRVEDGQGGGAVFVVQLPGARLEGAA